jgi:signal transduction histidine kinase
MLENYRRIGRDFNLSTEELLIASLKNNMLHSDKKDVAGILKIISSNEKITAARIISPDKNIDFSLNPSEQNKNLSEIDSNFLSVNLDSIVNRKILALSRFSKSYFRPIPNLPECRRCHSAIKNIAYLNITMNYEENIREISETFHEIIIAGFLFVISIIVIFSIAFRLLVSRRLQKVKSGFDEIRKGNFKYKLPVTKHDEIGNLEVHFNEMVDRLNSSRIEIEELNYENLMHLDKLVTLGELTAGVSHQINNYSAILFSRLDYLMNEFKNNEKYKEYTNDIRAMLTQVENMSNITKNILRHSKKSNMKFQRVELNSAIKGAIKLMQNALLKKSIELTFEPEQNLIINGDPSQLEQVFINLISNSIDALTDGGRISVTVFKDASAVTVIFKDNGCGIDKNEIKNIFMPFFTTKEEDKGSGLGLFIVQRILKNHNAEIICESEKLKGAKFIISFRNKNEEE